MIVKDNFACTPDSTACCFVLFAPEMPAITPELLTRFDVAGPRYTS